MKYRLVLLTLTLVGGFVFLTSQRILPFSSADTKMFSGLETARTAGLSPDELNNVDVYKRARLATVNVTSTVYRRTWFEVVPSKDIGSGFLIDDKGHILTNNHVLQGSSKVQVTLENQEIYDGVVLARDRRNDLGLVKITPKRKLPYLQFGDSDHMQIGQKVLAIGNPFGLDGTLTTGIVSSLGRDIPDDRGNKLDGMIQTDAAINPGNSGGPLLDSQGNVIGINTAIYGAAGNIGIGFAMPISRAKKMVEDYQAGKRFGRPMLGVAVVYVRGDLAQALELPSEGGLLVQEVGRGTPAEQAGLRGPRQIVVVGNIELGVGGDLIMALDGKPVDRNDAITRALSTKRPGDKLELTIHRGGRVFKASVVLGEDLSDQ
ncbi:MAG TPA: trypsin-like peptidase domain-containing protein [Bryobacteraceae bacterium]|nr:trypsin-like peptidase domain-containing protein [Bryobacteraceae bacterium]